MGRQACPKEIFGKVETLWTKKPGNTGNAGAQMPQHLQVFENSHQLFVARYGVTLEELRLAQAVG